MRVVLGDERAHGVVGQLFGSSVGSKDIWEWALRIGLNVIHRKGVGWLVWHDGCDRGCDNDLLDGEMLESGFEQTNGCIKCWTNYSSLRVVRWS